MKLESLKLRKHFEEFRTTKTHKYHGKYLVILSLKKDIENPKLGIRISRKIGNAVRRNRIRRIIRETLRQNIAHIRPDCHYLIIPRAFTKELSNRALSKELREDLSRRFGFTL
ncbi:MAG: ribonuclease P protein component [Candidatus Zixiibacteriota bacterium]